MKGNDAIVAVILGIVGVAAVAVIVSKQANTSGVLAGLGKSIAGFLCTAMSPITGEDCRSLTEDVHSTITF
jgi:hypothetical protein